MKRTPLLLLSAGLLSLGLTACGTPTPSSSHATGLSSSSSKVAATYTVIFEASGARHMTVKVKEGEKITATVTDPTAPEGKKFDGWYNGDLKIDLATYVVNADVTLVARFSDADPEPAEDLPDLDVNATKEAGQSYYMVLGWWETTATNDDGTPKKTSNMVEDDAIRIYANIIRFLKLSGVSDADIGRIQFRNYSSENVAAMGTAINDHADVDIMFGVGNNINSSSNGANVSLYQSSNDYKFQAPTGSTQANRYVALTTYCNEHGVALFNWLKNTSVGKDALVKLLTDEEIEPSLEPETIDLTVTVHGDTNAVTKLEDRETAITMPEITAPEGKHFVGFATSADGEVVLEKAVDASIKYGDLEELATGATLDLYPVFEDNVIAEEDLVVYVQLNSSLAKAEAELLEARFAQTVSDKELKFNLIEGNASTFSGAIGADADVIIGGNNPVNNLNKHADGPTANAGAGHFADGSRKVIISASVSSEHLDLAKSLYNFVKADAPTFDVYSAVWTKGGDWVTTEELTGLKTRVASDVATYMGVASEAELGTKYNVTLTYQEVTTSGNKVADLGTATRALREGKGADLIIGCGGNVDTTGGMTIVEKQNIDASLVAAGRMVALINDNALTRTAYEKSFTVPTDITIGNN